MDSIIDNIKSKWTDKAVSVVSMLVSYLILAMIGLFVWMMVNVLFVLWFGNMQGSYVLALSIMIGINLLVGLGLYLFRKNWLTVFFLKAVMGDDEEDDEDNSSEYETNYNLSHNDSSESVMDQGTSQKALLSSGLGLIVWLFSQLTKSKSEKSGDRSGTGMLASFTATTAAYPVSLGFKILERFVEIRKDKHEEIYNSEPEDEIIEDPIIRNLDGAPVERIARASE